MKKFRLTKEDSKDLGFASLCLTFGALTLDDFKQWIYYIIEYSDIDDIPTYLFDYLDVGEENGPNFHEVVPWVPCSGLKDDTDYNSVSGIFAMRGGYNNMNYEPRVSKGTAIRALKNSPHIEKRFRESFPFIEWEGFLDPITLEPKDNVLPE